MRSRMKARAQGHERGTPVRWSGRLQLPRRTFADVRWARWGFRIFGWKERTIFRKLSVHLCPNRVPVGEKYDGG